MTTIYDQMNQPRGIPDVFEDAPYIEAIEGAVPLDEILVTEGVSRIMAPANTVFAQVLRYLHELHEDGLGDAHKEQAHAATHIIDTLRWSEFRLVIQLALRMAQHLPALDASIEEMLQTMLRDAGVGTAEAANAVLCQLYAQGPARSIRDLWSDFDPTGLSVLRPRDLDEACMDVMPRPSGSVPTAD